MQKRSAIVAATAVVAALAAAIPAQAEPIPGSYIVVLERGKKAKDVTAQEGIKAKHHYAAALSGFAAELSDKQLDKLRRRGDVVSIEQDQTARAVTTETAQSWGLDRVDQRTGLDTLYTYDATSPAVHAYVIDTGVQADHPDFGGRATMDYNSAGGRNTDCNGHGTHVAGTIGGTRYGLAKAVRLHGVKVLNCRGSGTYSGIIAGVDWVRANARRPAVANMSLGGGVSSALNTAVNDLADAGVFTAVAAGNETTDACTRSPASASRAYTTAASDRTDRIASFSNFGTCVDGYAPGVGITSDWKGSGTNTISGTSMASPHVAGVAALFKHGGDAASSTVSGWIDTNATAGVIQGNPSGTPNRLLFKSTL